MNERDQEVLDKQNKTVEETKSADKPILSEFEKKYYYAFSRFPTEIIEGKLFLVIFKKDFKGNRDIHFF